jgi:hypothetical protein
MMNRLATMDPECQFERVAFVELIDGRGDVLTCVPVTVANDGNRAVFSVAQAHIDRAWSLRMLTADRKPLGETETALGTAMSRMRNTDQPEQQQ